MQKALFGFLFFIPARRTQCILRGFPPPSTFLPCHLNSSENKCTVPTEAFNTRGNQDQPTGGRLQNDGVFSDAWTETGHNFKAQSHTLIWTLKLSRCLGASNSSFCKTIIMTNVCISSLPNPPSMSLAWGNAAEKLIQICYKWLPIGNGLKLGTRMVWCESWKCINLTWTSKLTYCKIGPDMLLAFGRGSIEKLSKPFP